MTFREMLQRYDLDPEIFDVIHKIPALPVDKPREPEYFIIPVPRVAAVYMSGSALLH